ncbi:MAG: N-acetylmuramoyl-L-alanine amidase, partial [Heyndrickxia sp.]
SATLDIPLNEVAYHANEKPCKISKLAATASYYKGGGANLTSIGVEMCVEKNGTIHQDTISRSVDVAVQLCKQFNLDPLKDIYRHYDITGKNCPAPWVKNGQEFEDFKKRVNEKLHPPVKAASVEQKAYRLVTGTFKNTKDQQAAADKLKKATGWVVYTIESNGLRLQTGTFKTKTDVAKAQKLVKDKFGWLTYIK